MGYNKPTNNLSESLLMEEPSTSMTSHESYDSFEDDPKFVATSLHNEMQKLRAVIAFLSVLLVIAVTVIVFLAIRDSTECAYTLVGTQPTDSRGDLIPQVLASRAQVGREDVMISGRHWEPMRIVPGVALSKGNLDPTTTAFVIIDMQPLFYDASSPWGTKTGLEGSVMSRLWQNQLDLGTKLTTFTGRSDSVFFTRYITPPNASGAEGIMRHYYGMQPEWWDSKSVTQDALDTAGANSTYLLGVMPELSPLIEKGAKVSTKTTGGAMGPGSTLPAELDAYFEATGAGNKTKTLIVAGVETDYCVISTVLGAIDDYYRIILVTDAIGSSQPNAAQAQLDYTLRRFDHMVDFGTAADIATFLS